MPAKSKAQQRFMGMVHSYNKGDMKDAPTSVKKAAQHLKDAQEEVEYMISEHPGAAEEGVYDKPKQAIKFLQVAQKALGKIT